MPTYPIKTIAPAIKTGYVATVDGVSYIFAVFPRELALHAAENGCADVAEELTGWTPSYGGPGRSFSEVPVVRVFGKKVLVTQRRGLDI